MTRCRLCDHDNIKGEDVCVHCGHPFVDDHLPAPRTAVERGILGDRVQALSPKPPITVDSATPVRDVLRLMVERRIGCVFVVDDAVLVGVFSERDALMRVNTQIDQLADQPVGHFMTPNPMSLPRDAKLAFAVRQMDQGGYRHLPIVNASGVLEGVVSIRDILAYLTHKMAESAASDRST